MLESVSDMISFIVMCGMTLAGFYCLFVVSDSHHNESMKKREEAYYSFYESMNDDYDEDEKNMPYYE